MKKISIPEESYWKLLELKARFHCKTWKELIDLLYRKLSRAPFRSESWKEKA